jgi:hypothetical protein
MNNLIEVLRYTIPSVVVFLTAYFLFKEFLRIDKNRRNQELIAERIRISLPIRLQAYERIILFLERISPGNLVMRLHKPELTAKEFHRLLVQTIRDEYTHNLSQQLYVSSVAWDKVKNAKEEMIRQINTSVSQMDDKASATDLSNKLLEMSVEKLATKKALDYLKGEAAKVF